MNGPGQISEIFSMTVSPTEQQLVCCYSSLGEVPISVSPLPLCIAPSCPTPPPSAHPLDQWWTPAQDDPLSLDPLQQLDASLVSTHPLQSPTHQCGLTQWPADPCQQPDLYALDQPIADASWILPLTFGYAPCWYCHHHSIPHPVSGFHAPVVDLSFLSVLSEQEQFVVYSRLDDIPWKDIQERYESLWKPITVQGLVMKLRRLREKHRVLEYIVPARTDRGPRRTSAHADVRRRLANASMRRGRMRE